LLGSDFEDLSSANITWQEASYKSLAPIHIKFLAIAQGLNMGKVRGVPKFPIIF
jgi:hypothetical protein